MNTPLGKDSTPEGKDTVRADLLARRRLMSESSRADAAEAIAFHVLATPVVSRARRVACYLSMPSEPGTGPLITALVAHGVEVIVPVALPGGAVRERTLDWVALGEKADRFMTSGLGIREPAGPRLGATALDRCDAIIVPALAVDHAGHRLGRGAGYYDRALAPADGPARAPVCAVVFTHELMAEVPHEPHDVPVQMAATPDGIFRVL